VDDLDIDSLSMVEIAVGVEDRFGVPAAHRRVRRLGQPGSRKIKDDNVQARHRPIFGPGIDLGPRQPGTALAVMCLRVQRSTALVWFAPHA
jgi:hypothetical protein